MISVSLIPAIPMSSKGILGLFFVIISSVKSGLKRGFYTSVTLIIINVVYLFFKINVDYKYGIPSIIMGSLIYLLTTYYLGGTTDKLRNKNSELQSEIEKRKNIESELKEKITILQSLMGTLPTPICFKDLECRYVGCNYAFAQWFGTSEEEIIGKNVYDLLDSSQAGAYNKMDTELLRNQALPVQETIATFTDGKTRNLIYSKTLIMNEVGIPSGIVDVMIDITDQKESENLRKSIMQEEIIIDEMKKYDRLKTEFFSNISHELRTPLNVILGATQIIEMQTYDWNESINPKTLKKNVMSIKQNSLRLLRLVNNLIDITKIDDQVLKINLKNWDIVFIVEEITLSVADYMAITLVFDTDIEEKTIACDEEKIERIILNLLSNAIKFTPKEGSIFVNIYDKGDSVCIKVRDTGIGIPLDKQSELFQRFCQINPISTRVHEGSGIGLNLVKSLVELHEGTITVESELGKGTTFSICLPCKLLKKEVPLKENSTDRHIRFEKIQLEFSDIYSTKNIH